MRAFYSLKIIKNAKCLALIHKFKHQYENRLFWQQRVSQFWEVDYLVNETRSGLA